MEIYDRRTYWDLAGKVIKSLTFLGFFTCMLSMIGVKPREQERWILSEVLFAEGTFCIVVTLAFNKH